MNNRPLLRGLLSSAVNSECRRVRGFSCIVLWTHFAHTTAHLTHKSVSCAVGREEVGRVLRVSFQFLPELQYVIVDRAHRRIIVISQRLFQEFVARNVPLLVVYEEL